MPKLFKVMKFRIRNDIAMFKLNKLIIFPVVLVIIYIFYALYASDSINEESKIIEFINLREVLAASINAAERGGVKVYEIRETATLHEKSKGKTAEGANDPLTDGDVESHKEMFFSLKHAFPSVDIISEEKFLDASFGVRIKSASIDNLALRHVSDEFFPTNDITIWIDPLDATQEYTENLRQYVTTMVCVAVKGVPTIGVIHKPFEKFTAWAWVDKAFNPNMTISHSPQDFKEGSPVKMIVSRSHTGSVIDKAKEAFGSNVVVTQAGGAGFKSMEVLSGRQDVYFHSTNIKKWDICAGNAILHHFGGKMTTAQGLDLKYDSKTDYINRDGLVGALHNHMAYLKKIKKAHL